MILGCFLLRLNKPKTKKNGPKNQEVSAICVVPTKNFGKRKRKIQRSCLESEFEVFVLLHCICLYIYCIYIYIHIYIHSQKIEVR